MTATILDGGDAPLFSITAADMPNEPLIGKSPSTPWTAAVKKACQIRGRRAPKSTAGPDLYGLKCTTISKLIQDLPGADQLENYVWQTFEESSEKTDKRRNTQKSSLEQLVALAEDSQQSNESSFNTGTASPTTGSSPSSQKQYTTCLPSLSALMSTRKQVSKASKLSATEKWMAADAFASADQTVAYHPHFGRVAAKIAKTSTIAMKKETSDEDQLSDSTENE